MNLEQVKSPGRIATFSVPHTPLPTKSLSDSTGKHVRIAGPCTISTDNAEKLWLYKALPDLKEHFSDPASPDYVILKMTPDMIRFMDPSDMKYTHVKVK